MITFFNKIGNTWVAKLIFVALGISMMAFWGIGGISNTARSDSTAIKVGSHKVSMSELSKAFDVQRAKFSQLSGQYVSPKQAIEMGLLQQTVQQQVAETLSKAIREDLGLTASDMAVRKYVERHPAFKDALGNFDRNLFMTYLTQMKLSEAEVAEQLRNELANQHLGNTIRLAAPTSRVLAEKMWQQQNEKRDVEGLLIETDKIALSNTPTEEDLKDYYEAYQSEFMLPETRDIEILALTPNMVAKTIKVDQSELDALYTEQKDSFGTPEKRHVYQMRFNDKENAQKAKQGLTAANFTAKAQEVGQKAAETDFGLVARTELLSELGEAAFKAQKGVVLGPIETAMGWHLLVVTEIQPAVVPDKNKIYADLRQKLVNEATYDTLYEKARELEDLLGEGKSLAEAAKQLGFTTQTFKNVDMAAQKLPKELQNQELMRDLFTLREHEASAMTEQGNGYLVAEVKEIYPVQAKSLTEVRDQVKQIWKSEQQKAALPELTEQATEQMKNGSIPAKLGKVVVVNGASRQNPKEIPTAAVNKVFLQSVGYESAMATTLPNGVFVSVVKRVQTPALDTKAMPDQVEQLSGENAELLQNGIVATYADKLGVNVNYDAIQKAFSVYQSDKE
ncbi:MAG: SurA N-terminal domain-containing protein [Alphaproteobacteria bacterium]|nr:SurA N-terminal domain-containing protein [Alphaproteobacteria bacterium]